MGKLIVQEFVTVDGMAAAADGSVDFVPASNSGDRSFGQRQLEFMESVHTILLGRVTYEMFAGYWPNATTGEDAQFAERINATPKVVVSRTLQHAPWGRFDAAAIVHDSAGAISALKRAAGGDIVVWGSLSLARSLADDNLVDEYQLIVCPIVMGKGQSLFDERSAATRLKLLHTRPFERGQVLLTYECSLGIDDERQ